MSSVSDKAPRHHPKRKPTQFVLKQSWEQKKLSSMPNFKQVAHCKASASLSQSTPRHFLLGAVRMRLCSWRNAVIKWTVGREENGFSCFVFAGLRPFRAQKSPIVTEQACGHWRAGVGCARNMRVSTVCTLHGGKFAMYLYLLVIQPLIG